MTNMYYNTKNYSEADIETATKALLNDVGRVIYANPADQIKVIVPPEIIGNPGSKVFINYTD